MEAELGGLGGERVAHSPLLNINAINPCMKTYK